MTRVEHLTRGVFNCHLHLRLGAPSPTPGRSSREAGGGQPGALVCEPVSPPPPTVGTAPRRIPPSAATGDARAEPDVAKPSRWVNHPAPRPRLGTEAEYTPRRGLLPLPARSALRPAVPAQAPARLPPAQRAQASTKGGVKVGDYRVDGPRNVHCSAALRLCASCCRPARFKFPGDAAFRLAGLSLSCAFIGGFEKHVGGSARKPGLGGKRWGRGGKEGSLARRGSGRAIPECLAR